MTGPLHLLRPLALAALDLLVGGLLFAATTSPLGLLIVAVGLLVLCHCAYEALSRACRTVHHRSGQRGV